MWKTTQGHLRDKDGLCSNLVEVSGNIREPRGQGAGVLGGDSWERQGHSQRKQAFTSYQLQCKKGLISGRHTVGCDSSGRRVTIGWSQAETWHACSLLAMARTLRFDSHTHNKVAVLVKSCGLSSSL